MFILVIIPVAAFADSERNTSFLINDIPALYSMNGSASAIISYTGEYTGQAEIFTVLHEKNGVLKEVRRESVSLTSGVEFFCVTDPIEMEEEDTLSVYLWKADSMRPLRKAMVLRPRETSIVPCTAFVTIGRGTYSGYVDFENHVITLDVPTQRRSNDLLADATTTPAEFASAIRALVPKFTFNDSTVTYDRTPRNFNSAQVYTFTNAGGQSETYTVALLESVLQRSFDFASNSALLVTPDTPAYGGTLIRHGAPGPWGAAGSGIWYQSGFSYATDADGAYLKNGNSFVRSQASTG